MVGLNMTMLSSMSVLLGSIRASDSDSIHLQHQSQMTGVGDTSGFENMACGCTGCKHPDCCCKMKHEEEPSCGCKGCKHPDCCCKMKHEEEPPCGCKGCKHPDCCCKKHSCRCHGHHNPHDKPCGCKGCNMPDCCCNKRLCCNDLPEVWKDPLEGIPTDDKSLSILLNLYWPLRDVNWYIDVLEEIVQNIDVRQSDRRKRRNVSANEAMKSTESDMEIKPSVLQDMATTIKNLSTMAVVNITDEQLGKIESLVSSIAGSVSDGDEAISSSEVLAGLEENTFIESKEDLANILPVFASSLVESENAEAEDESLTTFRKIVALSVSAANISEESAIEVLEFAADSEMSSVIQMMGMDSTAAQMRALDSGEKALEEREALEQQIQEANFTFEEGDPSLLHQLGFKRTDEVSLTMSQLGIIVENATELFVEEFRVPSPSLVGMSVIGDIFRCRQRHVNLLKPIFWHCNPCNPYRNLDGSCNNLFYWSTWGVAFTPYRRDLPAVYSDGISAFRKSVAPGNPPLPSARLISTTVNRKPNIASQSFSILHMTYGQFLDHDLAATPLALGLYGFPVRCCNSPFSNPNCAPIVIPSDDPFYSCHGQTCMEFVRSAPAGGCIFGPRNQINQHTAYIDGSVIYGVTPSQANDVRSFVNGQLKVQLVHANEELLPHDPNPNNPCNQGQTQFCFMAGDGRVNEQILLTFLHTLFAREHNRLAKNLKHCNPSWDDEKLFQETRRIIGAQLQQVTYNEFVPTLIGPTLMTKSKLYPLMGDQQNTDYNPTINSAIANEFAAAAYRFGHSQIADQLLNINKHGAVKPKELNSYFFHPFELYDKHGVCDIGRGGTALPDRLVDPYFTPEVAGKLFRGSRPWGLDLLALNIQRGRDHGLASYNSWRVKCGLPRAWWFGGLLGEMTQERVNALQAVYSDVDDIDLYVGGLSEKPIAGGMMGHTFTCLLHNQFLRIKRGDRYWFEYKHSPGRFTSAQMEQLHNVTLAGIMCNNLPELDYVQRWPLKQPGPDNPVVCCKSIRQYNLDPWKEDCMNDDRDPKVDC